MVMDYMGDGHSWSMSWGMPFMGLFFWILVIAGVVVLIRWLMGQGNSDDSKYKPETAIDILNKRYARGEIDKDTWLRMKKELEQ